MSLYGLDHFISQALQAGIDGAVQQRSAQFKPDIGEDVVELRPVNFVAWVGGMYLLLAAFFLVGTYLELPSNMGWFMLAGCVTFLLVGSWLIRFRYRYRVYFNAQKFYLLPVFGALRTFPFKDVASIGRSRNGKDQRITMVSGKKVTISHYLIGMPALAFAQMNPVDDVN